MNMREYAILASIAHAPKSGYDVARWFENVASHFCTAGYGSVYPALGKFEAEGLVVHETVPSELGPDRKVYTITESGKDALLGWSEQPAAPSRTHDEQLVKALSYGFLPPARAKALLEEARERHAQKLSYYRELERGLRARLAEDAMSEEAYVGTMLTLMRGIGAEESYVRWCKEATKVISSRGDRRKEEAKARQ